MPLTDLLKFRLRKPSRCHPNDPSAKCEQMRLRCPTQTPVENPYVYPILKDDAPTGDESCMMYFDQCYDFLVTAPRSFVGRFVEIFFTFGGVSPGVTLPAQPLASFEIQDDGGEGEETTMEISGINIADLLRRYTQALPYDPGQGVCIADPGEAGVSVCVYNAGQAMTLDLNIFTAGGPSGSEEMFHTLGYFVAPLGGPRLSSRPCTSDLIAFVQTEVARTYALIRNSLPGNIGGVPNPLPQDPFNPLPQSASQYGTGYGPASRATLTL